MQSSSPLPPPWMPELVARNHKIVRSIWHSTESYLNGGEHGTREENNEILSTTETAGNNKSQQRQVVEPKLSFMNVTPPIGRSKSEDHEKSNHGSTSKLQKHSEKSPIPGECERGYMDLGNPTKSMRNGGLMGNGEEDSIIEYGPGIVRKLRSRYQSLALRQYAARPTLWRSASVENLIDTVDSLTTTAGTINRETPSPAPTSLNDKSVDVEASSNCGTAVSEQRQPPPRYEKKSQQESRGRTAVAERKDRMRRARSVDTLERPKQKEEIMEKLKSVVLPKEEIVIIEVSSSRPHGNRLYNHSARPPNLHLPTNEKAYSATSNERFVTLSERKSEIEQRTRSLISPEHELPPPDIVRETARIFEKNQENNKRIGQALRLNKSPPGSTNHNHGQTMSQDVQQLQKIIEKSPPSSSSALNKISATHGSKQIGIIRPTVSNNSSTTSSNDANIDNSNSNVGKSAEGRPDVISPILSSSHQSYKSFLQQHSAKPPLSPKPLFVSSPKLKSPEESTPPPYPPTTAPRFLANKEVKASLDKNVTVTSPPPVPKRSTSNEMLKPQENENNAVNLGDRNSHSPIQAYRAALKPVSKNFTISSNEKDIVPPAISYTLHKNTSASPSASVKDFKPLSTSSPTPAENKPKTVTAKVTEGPKLSFINPPINNGQQRSPSPQRRLPSPQPPHPAKVSSPPRIKREVEMVNNNTNASQLRAHQKQKSNEMGNSTMVFNFTSRSKVPDYIEDDGLHGGNGKMTLAGTVTDESVDDTDSIDLLKEAKNINFVGANIIINGKSSLQRRPKSMKMNISFNEDAITTYEYPSELSLLVDDDESFQKDTLGNRGPNVISNPVALGSYTPKLGGNDYQLGNFDITPSPRKPEPSKRTSEPESIEEYLKPDSDPTNWSNEMTSDILF